MAFFTNVNGNAAPTEAIGREVFFKNFSKGSAMTQADLNALVADVSTLATITVLGTFVAGTSTSVSMVIEGFDVTTSTGYVVTSVAGF